MRSNASASLRNKSLEDPAQLKGSRSFKYVDDSKILESIYEQGIIDANGDLIENFQF